MCGAERLTARPGRCVDAAAWGAATTARAWRLVAGAVRAEPEAAVGRDGGVRVARLAAAAAALPRPMLRLRARGALSGLVLAAQPSATAALDAAAVELRVHAVGLNFRDVLNVLGEYPGDPGPPGADCRHYARAVGAAVAHVRPGDAAFGLAHAALAHTARALSLIHI